MLKCQGCCDTGWVLEPAKIVGQYPPGTRLSAMRIVPEVWRLCLCQLPIGSCEDMGYRVEFKLVEEGLQVKVCDPLKEKIYSPDELGVFLFEAEDKSQLQRLLIAGAV